MLRIATFYIVFRYIPIIIPSHTPHCTIHPHTHSLTTRILTSVPLPRLSSIFSPIVRKYSFFSFSILYIILSFFLSLSFFFSYFLLFFPSWFAGCGYSMQCLTYMLHDCTSVAYKEFGSWSINIFQGTVIWKYAVYQH